MDEQATTGADQSRLDVQTAVAERVRKQLMDAAASAYEDARISGLCGEGAWEIAYGAMRDAPLKPIAATRDHC